MLRLLQIVFIVILIWPMAWKATIVVDYLVDYQSYLESCENMDKPEMQCNGKCQLNKELQKVESTEQQEPTTPSIISFEELQLYNSCTIKLSAPPSESISDFFHYSDHYSYLVSNRIVYPPIFG